MLTASVGWPSTSGQQQGPARTGKQGFWNLCSVGQRQSHVAKGRAQEEGGGCSQAALELSPLDSGSQHWGWGAPLNSCQGGGALGNSSQASEEARAASHVASPGIVHHVGSAAPRCQTPGLLEARWPLAIYPIPFCPSLLRAYWPQHRVQSEHLYSAPELPALTPSPVSALTVG